jgi:glycosyltransferase involved in cell wall biosynthesis
MKDKNKMNETVSVVMSTYNGAGYIEEQLDSILHQTYTNLQIIINDDASTDNTFEILKSYAAKDARIFLCQQERNAGYNISFSHACSKATGKFIAISDQDDIWELNKIEEQVKKINEKPNNVLVHCISARFEDKTKPHLRSIKKMKFFRGNNIKKFYLANYVLGHAMLFRRCLLDVALPFPPNVCYDWWLAACACTVGNIEFMDEILVWHRIHQSNATGAAKPKVLFKEQTKSILPTILSIDNIPQDEHKFGRELLNRYQNFSGDFSWPVFWFLFKNAPIVFGHKRRLFPWLSYLKHSLRYANASSLA